MNMKLTCALVAAIGLGTISAPVVASAAVIVKPFLGGPFSPGNALGTIAAIQLSKKNTYDFTFAIDGGGDVLTQIQASVSGPTSEPIQYTLYSGSPGSGVSIDQSTKSIAPSLTDLLGVGSYYVQVDFIAKNNELLTGGLDVSSAVPEPAAWGMILLGFVGLGAALRSNRREPVATAA